jgi:hypothetical protein
MTICRHSSGPTTETICYAGIEAEKKFSSMYNDKESYDKESYGDYCQIHGFASIFGMEEDTREAYLNWLILTARDMVSGPVNWRAVQGVAEELLEKKKLTDKVARDIIRKILGRNWGKLG